MSRPDWIQQAETNGYAVDGFEDWRERQDEIELVEGWLDDTKLGAAVLADLGEQYQMECVEDVYVLIMKHYKDEYEEYLYERYKEDKQGN